MSTTDTFSNRRRTPFDFVLVVLTISILGCHTPNLCSRRCFVSSELSSRTGSQLGSGGGISGGSFPPGITVDDGLTADEAVATALWNNSAYHELLAQLGISRAQLFNAGLISDPQFIIYFPMGPNQLQLTTYQAVDALWLRPIRQRAAQLDLCELSQTMVQNGLNLVRDVRVAHANLVLAQQRAALTEESFRLREQIARLAEKRLEGGDISELEATTSQVDSLQSEALALSNQQDIRLAQETLRVLLGTSLGAEDILAVDDMEYLPSSISTDQLVQTAFAMRPDLRALELRKTAACERARLARKQFMNLDAVFYGKDVTSPAFQVNPGLRFTLPIFNGNRGNIAIADAVVQQVDRQYASACDRIQLEVRTAATQLRQAEQQRALFQDRILPKLAAAAELARRNYVDGGVAYFLVLQATGQHIDTQVRRIEAEAAFRRARAELERGVGRRILPGETLPVIQSPENETISATQGTDFPTGNTAQPLVPDEFEEHSPKVSQD
ncbi:MAG: TolC family protein [Planctomycetaceae bacterium]